MVSPCRFDIRSGAGVHLAMCGAGDGGGSPLPSLVLFRRFQSSVISTLTSPSDPQLLPPERLLRPDEELPRPLTERASHLSDLNDGSADWLSMPERTHSGSSLANTSLGSRVLASPA